MSPWPSRRRRYCNRRQGWYCTITATTELGGVKAELPVTVEPMNAQNAAAADLDAAMLR